LISSDIIDAVSSNLTPVFIRLPKNQAAELNRLANETGRPKQHVVSELVGQALTAAPRSLAMGRAEVFGTPQERDDEVLTLDEVAALLKLPSDAVRSRVERGEVPARRFGDEWRFSKLAVLAWLADGDGRNTRRGR
jgi:excisionase family DNA binding protein